MLSCILLKQYGVGIELIKRVNITDLILSVGYLVVQIVDFLVQFVVRFRRMLRDEEEIDKEYNEGDAI